MTIRLCLWFIQSRPFNYTGYSMSEEQVEIVTGGNNLKQKFKLTRKQIIIVIILLAAIGTAFLIKSFAAENVVATLKGYTMVYQVGNTTKISKVSDSGATDKTALGMYWAGTASQTLTVPKVTKINVRAKADICKGAPTMILKVDGKEVARWSVNTTKWTTFTKETVIAAGARNIQIAFPNDYSTRSCDRNLRLDTVTFIGSVPETQPAVQAPVLKVSGQTITWNELSGVSKYVLATTIGTDRSTTTYSVVTGTNLTPPVVPGKTVYYGIRADVDGAPWSQEVSISYPETNPSTPVPDTTGGGSNMIVGLDIGSYGASGVADAKAAVGYVRLEENRFTTIDMWKNSGLKIVINFSGNYNPNGVLGLGDPAAWAASTLTRYKNLGCDPSACPILEVLNEPGGDWFWGANANSQANADAYAKLLVKVYDTFHNAYGASAPKILATYDGAGVFQFGDRWWNSPYIDRNKVDGVVIHPYGGKGEKSVSAQGKRGLVQELYGKTNKPVYVTEVGWPTAISQPSTGDSLQWTEAEQAANIHNFITWARGTGYVHAVIIFNYRDFDTNMWYGVTRSDGSKKPSYSALRCAAQNKPLGCQ